MIQRIQSVILFLIAVLMIGLLFMPIWKNVDRSNTAIAKLDAFSLTVSKVSQEPNPTANTAIHNTFYIGAIALLAALTALFSIFQYKKRMLQIKLGLFNTLLISLLLGAFYLAVKEGNQLLVNPDQGIFQIGFFVPMAAIALNFLANRYIKKDEALVRSIDRIR